MSKLCTKCKEVKFDSDFSVDRKNKDGLQCWCKACQSSVTRATRRRNNHSADVMIAQTKQCTNCEEVKLSSAFSKLTRSKDGLQIWCKACQSESRQSKRIREGRNIRSRTKQCTKCQQYKPFSEFGVDNRNKDKKSIYCKECNRQKSLVYLNKIKIGCKDCMYYRNRTSKKSWLRRLLNY